MARSLLLIFLLLPMPSHLPNSAMPFFPHLIPAVLVPIPSSLSTNIFLLLLFLALNDGKLSALASRGEKRRGEPVSHRGRRSLVKMNETSTHGLGVLGHYSTYRLYARTHFKNRYSFAKSRDVCRLYPEKVSVNLTVLYNIRWANAPTLAGGW